MEEYSSFFHQYQTNPLDYTLDGINFRSFSSDRYYPERTYNNRSDSQPKASQAGVERPAKQQKTCPSSSSTWILSFDKSNSISPATCHDQQVYDLENASCSNPNIEIEYSLVEEDKRVGSMTRNPSHAQEHVIAERKRREKLNQLFISLSTILPGLKKMDKASIIGNAIKHLKQLQERVKMLEEQEAKMTNIIVKKTHICSTDDETSSSNEIFDQDQYLPEIEARVWDRNAIIISIHCEKKNKGCIASILKEIENHHLSVVNSNVLPFGNSTLYITVVAQKNVESSTPMKDLVKNLKQALLKLII
ncbi:hypothetical protein Ddye_009759 [Dipteronia dyeriana]|uniref:BHLH domain-containing protein n=1 Tax=Dipteronia dyeriana TaxID=168575 RepID=A0AAD9XCD1_9ROSI|nr:hypothetical protein Ddye_009759 [Dipteronia dyeriana]